MPVSNEEIERRVRPHLPPGERFVAAFQASEGIAARLSFQHRVVAVTDRQIHVWRAKQLRVCSPGRLLSSHPLGAITERPLAALATAREIVIGDRRLWVDIAFTHELDAAFAPAAGRPIEAGSTQQIKRTYLLLTAGLPAAVVGLYIVSRIIGALGS